MQRYENIDKKLQKELSKMDSKFENESGELSNQDLELIDCLFHALKSAEGYYTMAESAEMGFSGNYSGNYGGNSGNSYARGRDSRGRYASREMMSREGGYSGRYPMMPMYGEYDGGRW